MSPDGRQWKFSGDVKHRARIRFTEAPPQTQNTGPDLMIQDERIDLTIPFLVFSGILTLR